MAKIDGLKQFASPGNMITFAKNDIIMETVQRVQTVLRLRPELMARVKRQARKENRSVNSFIERTLEKMTETEWPKLPSDFKVSEEIESMGRCIKAPTQEMLQDDPKLAYLWERYGE